MLRLTTNRSNFPRTSVVSFKSIHSGKKITQSNRNPNYQLAKDVVDEWVRYKSFDEQTQLLIRLLLEQARATNKEYDLEIAVILDLIDYENGDVDGDLIVL